MKPPYPLVDVHCHIFNVLDVPAYAYVMDVAIENPLLRAIAAPLVALFVEIAEFRAPTYAEEYAVLLDHLSKKATAAGPRKFGGPDVPRHSPVEQFVGGFWAFINRFTKYTSNQAQLLTPDNTAPYDNFVVEHLFERFLPRIIRYDSPFAAIGRQMKDQARALAGAIMGTTGFAETADYIRQFLTDWAPKLSDYRFQLADLTGRFNSPGGDPVLLTPATLDITHWLQSAQNGPPPTRLADQAELMCLISLLQTEGQLVHGFIAYDPWRQVDDVAQHRAITALNLVQIAIEEKGFAGVKLYPPMGFRATDNASIADSDFPPWLAGPYPNLGVRLDKALYSLYDYCATRDVPIMAHCAPTQGPDPKAAGQADPEYWKQLLDRSAYKNLRVNLGHFGGIWDLNSASSTWTSKVIDMIGSGLYPNLYADFADFSDILGRTPDQTTKRGQILAKLVQLIGTNPAVKLRILSHILYGSDWHLLDREPGNADYPDAMATQMDNSFTGDALPPKLFLQNGARFLGLVSGGKTLGRLTDFYNNNNGNPNVLVPFTV
jgi:predicted TIM-barrel fold metal-dependent hydrolase